MSIPLHQGQRLKWWVERKFKQYSDFINTGAVKSYEMLNYYFSKEQIKKSKIDEFCRALDISTEQFYISVKEENTNVNHLKEDSHPYQVSKHQGRNLQSTLKEKGISISSFADKMKVSRPMPYKWFKEKELETGVLLEAAHALKIPVAQLKGMGDGQPSFERDIYQQLKTLNDKISHLETLLLQFTKQQ